MKKVKEILKAKEAASKSDWERWCDGWRDDDDWEWEWDEDWNRKHCYIKFKIKYKK